MRAPAIVALVMYLAAQDLACGQTNPAPSAIEKEPRVLPDKGATHSNASEGVERGRVIPKKPINIDVPPGLNDALKDFEKQRPAPKKPTDIASDPGLKDICREHPEWPQCKLRGAMKEI